jgi:NADP-dependent 3-hydroxy acid dehydrogenase YdfG
MLSPSDIAKIVLNVFGQPKKVLVEDVIIRPIKGDI